MYMYKLYSQTSKQTWKQTDINYSSIAIKKVLKQQGDI